MDWTSTSFTPWPPEGSWSIIHLRSIDTLLGGRDRQIFKTKQALHRQCLMQLLVQSGIQRAAQAKAKEQPMLPDSPPQYQDVNLLPSNPSAPPSEPPPQIDPKQKKTKHFDQDKAAPVECRKRKRNSSPYRKKEPLTRGKHLGSPFHAHECERADQTREQKERKVQKISTMTEPWEGNT
ncbi:hypothetical protein SKAU_G00020090 [Synaphobranchus kaupii]|uniref:Uncharacterized protein n=1 Tax=Synaphobranchus kaupii TaxID=118154 RepID=A0A9Q1GCY0_SYNKA|nr:hypothetical protein SKAU_G00020090 [Synaphobranchus kaupii]